MTSYRQPSIDEVREFGARKRAESQAGDPLGPYFSDSELADLGVPVEMKRFRPAETMTPLEKAAAAHAEAVTGGDKAGKIAEGIGAGSRAAASFKFDRQAVYNYLRETYGGPNVAPVRDPNSGEVRNFAIRDDDGKIKLFDPEGLDWGDAADLARDVAEAAPGVAGAAAGAAAGTAVMPGVGTVVGALAGGAAGDAAGSAGVQAVGKYAVSGSEDHVTGRERLLSAGANVAGGVLGELGGAAAKGVFKTLPRKALRGVVTSGGEQSIKEGLDIESRTGVKMSATALANTPQARTFEQMLAQRPGTTNTIVGANQATARNMGAYLDKTFDAQLGKSVGGEAAGKNAGHAYRGARDTLIEQRSKTAAQLFGEVDKIAGDTKLIDAGALKARLEELVGEVEPQVHTTGMKSKANELRFMLNTIPADGKMSAGNLQRLLSEVGKAAQGSGKLFKELDEMADKRAARELFAVLNETLDTAASAGGKLGAAGQALIRARDVYRGMSKQIEELDQVMVEKAFKLSDTGKSEFLARDIMSKGMSDENVRAGFTVLRAADPASANNLSRAALEHEFADLAPKSGIPASADVPIDPARMARWAKEKRPRLEAMLGKNSPVLQAIDDMAEVGRRTGPISSDVNSQTSRMFWYNELFSKFKGGELNAIGAAQTLASLSTPKRIAETLTDPRKRDIFLGLVRPPRNVTLNAVKDSIARLSALQVRDAAQAGDVEQKPERVGRMVP